MKGLIFSEVTIEEQIVWPKADSGPQKTRKKIVWKVQQQENIYRITLHFLFRKNKTAELHWKERDKGRGLAEKQTQERSKPLTIALRKKKTRLLASPFKGCPIVVRWGTLASSPLPVFLSDLEEEQLTWQSLLVRAAKCLVRQCHFRGTALYIGRCDRKSWILTRISLFLKGNESEQRHVKNNEGS